jgi:deoxycytidylate deaminase
MDIIVIAIIGDLCCAKKTIADTFISKYGFYPLENNNNKKANLISDKKENEISLEKDCDIMVISNLKTLNNFDKLTLEEGIDNSSDSDKYSEISNAKTGTKYPLPYKKESLKEKIKRTKEKKIVIYPYLSWEDYLELRNKTSFRILNIFSSSKKRFENFQMKYPDSKVEEFFQLDQVYTSEPNYQKLRMQAFSHIENEGTLMDLEFKIEKLQKAFSAYFRPSWDDYFMSVAHILADRCNCIKQKVGAILVKNNRIVSTGYNGTPSRIENCYKGGCERCNNLSISQGKDLDTCFCLHAEENAVKKFHNFFSKFFISIFIFLFF